MTKLVKCDFLDPAGFNELGLCRGGPRLYNKHDIYVGGSLALYGEFSHSESELFGRLIGPGQIVVEAGANIGVHTVDLARLVGHGQVYAFEPQRLVFQTLCANLALNQITNVFAYQAGLGAARGAITVPPMPYTERNNFGGVSLMVGGEGDVVELATIDALNLPHCHFVKIDVEGMECEVLKGGAETIANYSPLIYVENDRAQRSEELLRLLESMGYDLYWHLAPFFNPRNFAGDLTNHFPEGLVSINVLCIPDGRVLDINLPRVLGPTDTCDAAWRRLHGSS